MSETAILWSVLRGARGRLVVLYMSGLVRDEIAAAELRRSIEDIDEVLQSAEKPAPPAPEPEPEQTEFWEVTGGMGGMRVACDLPSRAEAEKVADRFAARMARADVPQSRTYVKRQSHRYGAPPKPSES